MPFRVLIDECFGQTIAQFFEDLDFDVSRVGTKLPSGAPDVTVAAAALAEGAVVVTHDSDFRIRPDGGANIHGIRTPMERAPRIYFKCPHPEVRRRLEELIDDIENEYQIAQRRNIRFTMHIAIDKFTVFR